MISSGHMNQVALRTGYFMFDVLSLEEDQMTRKLPYASDDLFPRADANQPHARSTNTSTRSAFGTHACWPPEIPGYAGARSNCSAPTSKMSRPP